VKGYWQGRVVIAQPNFSRLSLICPNGCPLPRFICSHRSGLRLEKLHCVPERYQKWQSDLLCAAIHGGLGGINLQNWILFYLIKYMKKSMPLSKKVFCKIVL
jgi:hypothetical protein